MKEQLVERSFSLSFLLEIIKQILNRGWNRPSIFPEYFPDVETIYDRALSLKKYKVESHAISKRNYKLDSLNVLEVLIIICFSSSL